MLQGSEKPGPCVFMNLISKEILKRGFTQLSQECSSDHSCRNNSSLLLFPGKILVAKPEPTVATMVVMCMDIGHLYMCFRVEGGHFN